MMKGLANVGDVLAGKYRVEKILGIGGMGMVVAATHLELDQQVALKFMLPAAMESPEASARFMREARAAGRLTSEHVCRVSDVGRFESGAPYIVMEYLEGYDLGTMLRKRGPLRVAAAIDYVLQACEGLAEAHAQGIIHRDLKPDNLYLSARADGGRIIKVLDFGISKAAVTGISTQTGDILGSPAYMAPEQMKSTKDVDARADVWSLGVVLYQLLTGRLPFSGDSLPNLCLSVINDEPVPATRYREDVPDGLSDVILRCLAKDREDRYANVGDMAAAIAEFASPGGFGSVTRVRSALKGRPAPPDPSQTVPHGFAAQGDGPPPAPVAPTINTIGPTLDSTTDERFAPRPAPRPTPAPPVAQQVATVKGRHSGAQAVGVSTLTSSVGESTASRDAPRARFPLGLAGALLGAIGLVIVLIVMVMRSRGDDAATDPAGPPRAAADPNKPGDPGAGSARPVPRVEPIVEPIVEPVGSGSGAQEPVVESGGDPAAGSGGPSRPSRLQRPPRLGRDPKLPKGGGSDAKDPQAGSGATAPPDAAPPPPPDAAVSDDDKWGRMQHDQPKGQRP